MAYIHVKIPLNFRTALFIFVGLSWITGLTFYILDGWFMVEGEFGPEKHPWQQTFLLLHGVSAFVMMIFYGAILFSHVPSTWRLNRLRNIGLTLAIVVGFQVISAWLLYYLGSEEVRDVVSNLHTLVGFTLPIVLTIHIIHGIRLNKLNKEKQQLRKSSTVAKKNEKKAA